MVKTIKVIERLGNDGDVVSFKVGDSSGIKQYALCKMSDARYALSSAAIADPIAGIAVEEKEANDGQTQLGMITNAIIEITVSGAVPQGAPLVPTVTPHVLDVRPAISGGSSETAKFSGANVVGYALEIGSANEAIEVRFRPGG